MTSNIANTSIRGKIIVGRVVSAKMHKTVTVEWERKVLLRKFERFTKKTSKVAAHNPENINAQEGDLVKIGEVRPLSKTKNFMVLEILEKATGN
ncbi:MAG: 30S ribosomal protein S17 [Candidatus Nanoarchaeia archaeon]|jgi:small subunit ribosomal protein S17|nr:30S ribosomal protein S17 [Candidatus Nanoarchaeia archaeon]